jgi:hypothetical protein
LKIRVSVVRTRLQAPSFPAPQKSIAPAHYLALRPLRRPWLSGGLQRSALQFAVLGNDRAQDGRFEQTCFIWRQIIIKMSRGRTLMRRLVELFSMSLDGLKAPLVPWRSGKGSSKGW